MATLQQHIFKLLETQKYNEYAVMDMRAFPRCVANTKEGDAAKARYDTWSKMNTGSKQLNLFLTTKTCLATMEKINKDKVKAAECSNFAYHAIGTLLMDKRVRKQYNICCVGIMKNQHNIAVLVPKDSNVNAKDINKGKWPKDCLIVDPWAVGMGHKTYHSLAVPIQDYVYKQALLKATLNYQSASDKNLETSIQQLETKNINKNMSLHDLMPQKDVTTQFKQKHHDIKSSTAFGNALRDFEEQIKHLENRGYAEEAKLARGHYDKIETLKTKFEGKSITAEDFSKKIQKTITEAQNSSLGQFRGLGQVFFNILNAVRGIFGLEQKKTETLEKLSNIEDVVKEDMISPRMGG